ncbi:MAG: hypothetical protein ACOCXJ_04565, partial [Planctomycetota bacterium]
TTVDLPGNLTDQRWSLATGQLQVDWHPADVGSRLQVHTPHGQATVLGTAFTAASGPWRSRFLVERGLVAVRSGTEQDRLAAGQAVSCFGERLLRMPLDLARTLPLALPTDDRMPGHDILPFLTDPAAAQSGSARVNAEGVLLDSGTAIRLPVEPGPSYDLHLRVRRMAGDECLTINLPRAHEAPLIWFLSGWHDSRQGFNLIGGSHDRSNETALWTALLPDDRIIDLHLRVRPGHVAVYVDGTLFSCWWPGLRLPDADSMEWPAPDPAHLRLATYSSAYTVLACHLQRADGKPPRLPGL